jgi:hypothetical protein
MELWLTRPQIFSQEKTPRQRFNRLKILIYFLFLEFTGQNFVFSQNRPDSAVCESIKNKHESLAVLIDKSGAINRGPINFGTHIYAGSPSDYYYIPTGYTLLVSPARHKLRRNGPLLGFLDLRKIKSPCADSNLYQVRYILQIRDPDDRSWLPVSIEDRNVGLPVFQDLNNGDEDASIKPVFDLRVVGKIQGK